MFFIYEVVFSESSGFIPNCGRVSMQTNSTLPYHGGLRSFRDIWYQIFLYCLATNLLMHCVAALFACRALRTHKFGRYVPIVLLLAGFLYPLTGGVITSGCISWIYVSADYNMLYYTAFIFGAGQSFLVFLVSFLRIYGTL